MAQQMASSGPQREMLQMSAPKQNAALITQDKSFELFGSKAKSNEIKASL
jgi:hypothetical protein